MSDDDEKASRLRHAERSSAKFDDPSPVAVMIQEVDEDDSAYLDARTFCDEGLCVYLHAVNGVVIMSPEQARAAATALLAVAERVEKARAALRGEVSNG
jgi:hypothetical protein